MSIELEKIARLRVYTEPNGSFDVDGTGTLNNYTDVPAVEGSITHGAGGKETFDPGYVQQFKDQYPEVVFGRRTCTLGFTMPLASTGTAASNGVTAVQGALGIILKAVMGGEDLGVGTTINDAGVDADDFDVTSATGLTAGTAIGVIAGGYTQWRIIDVISSSNVATKLAFSTSPANGATVNSCASYYLTEDPNTSLQFIYQGAEPNDGWVFLGCQLQSMSIGVTDGIWTISFQFLCARWMHGSEVSGSANLDGYTIAAATYSNISPVAAVAGAYYQQTVGTVTYTASTTTTEGSEVHAANEQWSPGLSFIPVPSPSASSGGYHNILRFVRNRSAPAISGSFTCPYQAYTTGAGAIWIPARDNSTDKAFVRVIGGTASSTVILEAATAQVTSVVRGPHGEFAGQAVGWRGRHDAETAGGSAQLLSAFRIHLG